MSKDDFIRVFSEVCKRTLYSSLGESAGEAILFFLGRDLGRDPFESLWDDPRAFYNSIERILGVGAKILISVLITSIDREYGLNTDPEYFLNLMRGGDQRSVEEIRSFMKRVADACKSGGGGVE
ncbi:MAG: hypothetical protein QXL85_04080 [Candidatus Bathyarchaeia archaeon]